MPKIINMEINIVNGRVVRVNKTNVKEEDHFLLDIIGVPIEDVILNLVKEQFEQEQADSNSDNRTGGGRATP